jgi:hypothetical protein
MMFLCKKCIFCQPSRLSQQVDNRCEQGEHPWSENKMMMHVKNGNITPIRDRPFKHQNAYFNMCYRLKFCLKDNCICAHSLVEQAVWIVENDMRLKREQIQEEMRKASGPADDDVEFVSKFQV